MRDALFLHLLLKPNLSLVIGVLSVVLLVDAQEDFTAETASAVPAYSTLSEEQALNMEIARRSAGSTGALHVLPDVASRSFEYQDLLDSEGPAGVAEHLIQSYQSSDANRDFNGVALMLLYEAGYIDRKTMTGEWRSGPLR